MTLLVWAKYDATETWYPALLGKGYESTGAYSLHVRLDGTVWFELDAADGNCGTSTIRPTSAWLRASGHTSSPPTMPPRCASTSTAAKPAPASPSSPRSGPARNRCVSAGSARTADISNGLVREATVYSRAMTANQVLRGIKQGDDLSALPLTTMAGPAILFTLNSETLAAPPMANSAAPRNTPAAPGTRGRASATDGVPLRGNTRW